MPSYLNRFLVAVCNIAVIVIIGSTACFGQTSIVVGNSYAFTVPTVVYRHYLSTHKTDTAQKRIALRNYRFTIVEERNNDYIIQFPQWKDIDSASRKLNAAFVNAPTSDKSSNRARFDSTGLLIGPGSPADRLFFAVHKQDLEKKVYRIYPIWGRPEVAAGSVIVPVKMRFSEFDFSRDFSLGFTVGPRWRISSQREHYLHILGAFNVNIVTIDSANTGGRVKKATDKGALGFAIGAVIDFNGTQVGAFVGEDWLGRRDRSNWDYQGKPWLSVGMGFTIFSRASNATNSGQVDNKLK